MTLLWHLRIPADSLIHINITVENKANRLCDYFSGEVHY